MTHRLEDFMCVCSPENKEEAEACLERVMTELGATPENFLSQVVYGSWWRTPVGEFDLSIDGFACDQWAATGGVVRWKDSSMREYVDHAYISVMCDEVEHGLARLWELAKESTLLEPPGRTENSEEN